MSGMHVGGAGSRGFELAEGTGSDELEGGAPANAAAPACRFTLEQKLALPLSQLEQLPAHELIEVAERHPEVAARLSLAKLTELGNACPRVLDVIYHSSAAKVPAEVPTGYATGTHVWVPNSGVDLPFLVERGVKGWEGKSFDAARGEMVDKVAWLPDSKAKAYVGDINAAIQGAAGGAITAPVNPDGRGALITDYTRAGQAFGVELRWIDEFRQLPNGTWLGVSYWMDGAEPKKWSYVLLDFAG